MCLEYGRLSTVPVLLQMVVFASFLFCAMFTLPRKERNILIYTLLEFNVYISHREILGVRCMGKPKGRWTEQRQF